MKKKKTLIGILGIVVITLIIFTAFLYIGYFDKKEEPIEEVIQEPVVEINNEQVERDLWLKNKEINSDYVGEIVFDSGIINKSFVQAKSTRDENGNLYHFYTERGNLVKNDEDYTGNDVYIWTNWKDMSYDYNIEGGSVFMDYRNDLNDQNLIIYGHHFSERGGNDPKREKAFTPLEQLLESNIKNETLKLILDNETRYYELVYVYEFNVYDDNCLENMQYYRPNYNYDDFENIKDDDYYKNYIDNMEDYKLYDTGRHLGVDDYTLTLQTCISGRDGELFEICVFKQTNIEYFE